MKMKRVSVTLALLTMFPKPTKTLDAPTFLAGATIAIALAVYANTPYTCPGCNKYINEGQSFEIKPGCPAQHRFHAECLLNPSAVCQGCLKDKIFKKRQEAKAQGRKEEEIRKDEREKIELQHIEMRKEEEMQNYIAQKQREDDERKEREEKVAQQQIAFSAQQQQERENQRLSFEREQDVIRLIDWMMVPCSLCSFPLAQRDAGSDILLDLKKHPKHCITLPCSQKNKPHRFHRSCLKKWSELHTICPIPSCGIEM